MALMLIDTPLQHSAENLISLISENDHGILKHSLDAISEILPLYWPELYDSIYYLSRLVDDTSFPYSQLAALVASKVCFYASAMDEALDYALYARDMFELYVHSEYNEAVIFKCIERYINFRRQFIRVDNQFLLVQMEDIIRRVIEDSISKCCYFNVIGLAIEMRSVEILETAILASGKDPKLLAYCVDCVNCSPDNLDFRDLVIQKVLNLYSAQENHSLVDVAQYLFLLNDNQQLIDLLKRLIYSDPPSRTDLPVALQICFDLFENCSQYYLQQIINDLQNEASLKTAELIEEGIIDISKFDELNIATLKTTGVDYKTLPYLSNLHKLVSILDGTEPNKLQIDFMIKSLKYDTHFLKSQQNQRAATAHTALAVCNSLVHLGTTSDSLIRTNVEWISWSVGWGRFVMIASLGIIHRGHGEIVFKVISPYLPIPKKELSSSHQEGGAFYAIGLAYANYGNRITQHHFMVHNPNKMDNVVCHGFCLGLGLATMGSQRRDVYRIMEQVLSKDDAISGEAAGISAGLAMLGSGDIKVLETLTTIIERTKHEKIQRGLALGIAMLFASKTKQANEHIEKFLSSYNPNQRMCGVYICAMAYAGTNDPYAINILWKTSISDSCDDVKRVAVIAIGIVMFREQEKFLGMALLFLQTHNAYLRCGTLFALGVVFAATGNEIVINLIRSIFIDSSFVVRQSAFIAVGMIMIQRNEKNTGIYREIRTLLTSVCNDRRSDPVAKFGAYIGFGILDAGCRNQVLTFQTLQGHTRIPSVVGFLIFQQFWYWFPLVHFISLCFMPTCIILVNPEFETINHKFKCDADISQFAYPAAFEKHKKEHTDKIRMSQFSQSMKSFGKRRNLSMKDHDANFLSRGVHIKKTRTTHSNRLSAVRTSTDEQKKPSPFTIKGILSNKMQECMTVPSPVSTEKNSEAVSDKKEEIPKVQEAMTEKPQQKPCSLNNPVRALPRQLTYMRLDPSSGSVHTVKSVSLGGIIVCYTENLVENGNKQSHDPTQELKDSKPAEDKHYSND